MRYTLLKMVQLILSGMDGDEVNGISDTVEATQVVDVIEQVYNNICSTIEFPEQWNLFELNPSLDITRPTLMYIPDDVVKVEWIQYDAADDTDTIRDWKYIWPMERQRFFRDMHPVDTADTNVYQFDYLVNSETFDVRGYKDRSPTYYTTVNNRTLIFNDFDAVQGQTLQGNKTKGYGMRIPVFVREDSFVPELEPRQFTLLFNEAKAQAFIDLKQVENAKAERNARRGWVNSQKHKATTQASSIHGEWTPNFGRRGTSSRNNAMRNGK